MAVSESGTAHADGCTCTRCVGFAPGNDLAVRHGALRADAVIAAEPRTKAILAWIEETAVVGAPCDHMTELRLAIVYRRIELATSALDESDRAAGDRPVASYAGGKDWLPSLRADLDRWMSRATTLERELGRTPLSRAKLGLDLAATKRELSVIEYYEARERAGLPLFEDEETVE
jgi:hypothetical protein